MENDVDIDVAQQQDFRGIRPQVLEECGFLFPLRQVKNKKLLVVKDVVFS